MDDGLKAEALNNFFSSVFTIEDTTNMPTLGDRPVLNTLNELNLTQADVQKILQNLKPDKAQGLDEMHPRVLRELNTELDKTLFILFRKNLEYEQIPIAWKEGQIIPIFKKGDKSSVSNYRPVSLTSVMGTIVRNNIMEHLIKEKLLADAQHGFVSGRSCVTQLIETIEEWTQMLDKGNSVNAVYLDFHKAFDTVAQKRLLTKLKGYGVNGKVLSWVKAFLTDRRQKVLVNQSQSDWAITCDKWYTARECPRTTAIYNFHK